MHKCKFQSLKRTLRMSQVFPHYILIKKKTIYEVIGFLSKHVGGRPETCINVRFRL